MTLTTIRIGKKGNPMTDFDSDLLCYSKEDVQAHVKSFIDDLKQSMDNYRLNNDLWRKDANTLLSEFLDLIDAKQKEHFDILEDEDEN
ncbi:MAG: hypothetical protein AABY15_03345 [Nanoarchaeota archaeon]